MTFYFTGDIHGDVYDLIGRLSFLKDKQPEDSAIVILGDVGFNYYRNIKDTVAKEHASMANVSAIYCVRGNHEARPDDACLVQEIYDENIQGYVYQENEFPKIKYLLDGHKYVFNKKSALVLGGAYSVDKFYRLSRGWHWFSNEQLSDSEKAHIFNNIRGQEFDLVLTHTCPYDWRPTDLFLDCVDQSTVDNSMEEWLQQVEQNITYQKWLFGHYHAERIVNDKAIMLYRNVLSLDEIMED